MTAPLQDKVCRNKCVRQQAEAATDDRRDFAGNGISLTHASGAQPPLGPLFLRGVSTTPGPKARQKRENNQLSRVFDFKGVFLHGSDVLMTRINDIPIYEQGLRRVREVFVAALVRNTNCAR